MPQTEQYVLFLLTCCMLGGDKKKPEREEGEISSDSVNVMCPEHLSIHIKQNLKVTSHWERNGTCQTQESSDDSWTHSCFEVKKKKMRRGRKLILNYFFTVRLRQVSSLLHFPSSCGGWSIRFQTIWPQSVRLRAAPLQGCRWKFFKVNREKIRSITSNSQLVHSPLI